MPSLGADMEAATLSEWCRKPGDAVKSGDIIAVVETDKGAIEVEVFATGTIATLLVEEGEKVPVGTLLAVIADGTEAPQPTPAPALDVTSPLGEVPAGRGGAPAAPAPEAPTPAPAEAQRASEPSPGQDVERIHASPAARYRARELDVDLATVHGSGRHGDIVRADVERADAARAEHAAPEPVAPERATARAPEPLATERAAAPAPERVAPTQPAARPPTPSIRRAIAAAMARSNREIPHYYLSLGIDLRHALAWLAERNASRPVEGRVLPAALLLHAVARSLPGFPELNGTWDDDAFHPSATVNLAVAVALRGGGLVNPCIADAASLGLDATMSALSDLVARTRSGRLRASEIGAGTITVTNLGDLGVDETFGIIYPPQVALVGFGRIAPQPVAVGDLIGVHPVVRMTLAADHRASDGHRGGLFLAAVDRFLQEIS